jgi:hypothetical protein
MCRPSDASRPKLSANGQGDGAERWRAARGSRYAQGTLERSDKLLDQDYPRVPDLLDTRDGQ